MATVCPPAQGARQMDVNGRRYTQGRDGKFHGVRDSDVKAMVKGGECFLPTMQLASGTKGWVCQDCGFVALIEHCGKCGSEDLVREG